MDELEKQIHTSEVLGFQGTSLGVYLNFNYSSQATHKGLLPGSGVLAIINTCKKMDYEVVKTFINRIKQTRIFSQIKTF